MTPSEAEKMGQYLKKCFPTLTDEKRDAVAKCFESCEVDATFEAIRKHLEEFDFVNARALIAAAKGEAHVTPGERAAIAAAESQQRVEAIVNAKKSADKGIETMFATVRGMPEAERERHRAAILESAAKLSPFLADRLRTADPTRSPTLAALICERAKGGRR